MTTPHRIRNAIHRDTTLTWTCTGNGGCGTSNPDDASRCIGCSRPW